MLYRFKSQATADVVMLEANARQLLDIVGKPGYVIIDIRDEKSYLAGHVKGAINVPFVLDEWRVRPLVGIDERQTERLFNTRAVEQLGISNDTHVVLIHAGVSVRDPSRAAFVF